MSQLQPGTYEAKILEYGLVQNKSGAPQVKVVFGLKNGPAISWFGGLGTDKQQEYTTKNLLTMGATKNNIADVEKGLAGGVLNNTKIYELVIEDHTYNGKTTQRIAFINDPATAKKQAFIAPIGALAVLRGKAAAIEAQGGNGAAPAPEANAGF